MGSNLQGAESHQRLGTNKNSRSAPYMKSLSKGNDTIAYHRVASDYAADSSVPILDRDQNAIEKDHVSTSVKLLSFYIRLKCTKKIENLSSDNKQKRIY